MKVAIKVVPKDHRKEFVREVQIMSRLKHRYILGLLDVFDEGESTRVVLELCLGGDLHDLLERRGRALTEDEGWQMLLRLR